MNDVVNFISKHMERDRQWDVKLLTESIERDELALDVLLGDMARLSVTIDKLDRAIDLLIENGMDNIAVEILDSDMGSMGLDYSELKRRAEEIEKRLTDNKEILASRATPTDLSALSVLLEDENNA